MLLLVNVINPIRHKSKPKLSKISPTGKIFIIINFPPKLSIWNPDCPFKLFLHSWLNLDTFRVFLSCLMLWLLLVPNCKWPIWMKETSIFDSLLFWMKSLLSEFMEIMVIIIDAFLWLLNNYLRYAAHIIATFTCCSLHQLVSGGTVTLGHFHTTCALTSMGWVGGAPSHLSPKEPRCSPVTSSQPHFVSFPPLSSFLFLWGWGGG